MHATRLLPLLLFVLGPRLAAACTHLPAGYEGSLAQRAQKALIFWNDGREELILQIDYRVEGGAGPEALGWVIPVPYAPEGYAVEDPAIFAAAHDLFARNLSAFRHYNTRSSPRPVEGLTLLEPATVGDYTIQPIQAQGQHAGPALNDWLTQNGFGAIPLANMAYYLERNWTFLAVRAPAREGRLAQDGPLQPLRISFASPEIVYPLKFSSHQGEFAVTAWIVTPAPLPELKSARYHQEWLAEEHWLRAHGFRGQGVPATLSAPLLQVLERASEGGFPRWDGQRAWITRLEADAVNGPHDPLAGWERDLALTGPESTRFELKDYTRDVLDEIEAEQAAEDAARQAQEEANRPVQLPPWRTILGGAFLLLLVGGVIGWRLRR